MTERPLHAISISKSVYDSVTAPGFRARVLASFERACDLQTDEGNIVAIVHPEIGNGAFHIVVEESVIFSDWPCGAKAAGDGESIEVLVNNSELVRMDIGSAACWDPQPDWGRLSGGDRLEVNLARLKSFVSLNASPRSLAVLGNPENPNPEPWKKKAQICIDRIETSWRSGAVDVYRGHVSSLSGLGVGLTPSGDDWLAGWMIGLHLRKSGAAAHQDCALILEAANGRTTTLSMAFLHAAAAGEVSQTWMHLLSVLSTGSIEEVGQAANQAMDFGATSGADMLAGFLSAAALNSEQGNLKSK